ncbi:unnamed protein product [Notodromas monacha]|uniref:Uncharacterized protein n=1 Tax=Notodromas monacha TaxID=399045 RepID=A0A7R9BF55_9CRUS|nr:unnamed protein product [Notodromas monacha]CAG0914262.1 unnamed protein product [Notodromas monacha]
MDHAGSAVVERGEPRAAEWSAFQDSLSADLRSIRVFTVVGLVMVLIGGSMLGVGLSVGSDTWALWRLGLAGFVLGFALTITSYWALQRRSKIIAIQQQIAAAAAVGNRDILVVDYDTIQTRDDSNRISVIYGTEDVWIKPPVYDPPPRYEDVVRDAELNISCSQPGPSPTTSSTPGTPPVPPMTKSV